MIYHTVTFSDFIQAFHDMGRGNQFSYSGLELIYEWLDSMGQDVFLDVIAICCDFEEVDINEYFESVFDADCVDDEEDKKELIQSYLEYNTIFVGFTDNTVVFCEF